MTESLPDKAILEELEQLQVHHLRVIAAAAMLEQARLIEEEAAAHPDPAGPEDLQKFLRLASGIRRRRQLARSLKKAYRAAAKAAVILLIVLAGGIFTVINVEAVRRPFLNWLIDVQETHTSIHFAQDFLLPDQSALTPVEFGYLPDGFRVASVDEGASNITYFLESDTGGQILVLQSDFSMGASLDTEDAVVTEFRLAGKYEAMSVEKEGFVTLVWTTEQAAFLMEGETGREELIKIAESIAAAPSERKGRD